MYSITSKFNSNVWTTNKATADKTTAKAIGKNSSFRFSVKNLTFEHAVTVTQRSMFGKFWIPFCLLNSFFYLILNENSLLLNFLSRFFISLPFYGKFNSIFAQWIAVNLIYGELRGGVCFVYSRPWIHFLGFIQLPQNTWEKN